MVASSQPRCVRQLPPSAVDGGRPRRASCIPAQRSLAGIEQLVAALWPPEQETLHLGGALLRKQPKLLLGLHTLGTGLDAEAVTKIDHGTDDSALATVEGELADERLVDLELVEGELLQVAQARVASAEIVHHEPHAQLAQTLEDPQCLFDIADQHVLGDLELEPFRCCTSLLEAVADHIDEVAVPELDRGNVERDSASGQPGKVAAGLTDDPRSDGYDKAGLLRDPQEFERREQAAPGMMPAQQRLVAENLAGAGGDLRLVVQLQLVAGQGHAQAALDEPAVAEPLLHRRLEEPEAIPAFSLGPVEGDVGILHQAVGLVASTGNRAAPSLAVTITS
jgi:hypothetical protein